MNRALRVRQIACMVVMTASASSIAGTNFFEGLPHAPYFSGVLAMDGNQNLVVTNPGPLEGGVTISHGKTLCWTVDLTLRNTNVVPVGPSRTVTLNQFGTPETEIAVDFVGGNYTVTPAFFNGSNTYELTAFANGQVVYYDPAVIGTAFAAPPDIGPGGIQFCKVCFISLGEDGWYAKCKAGRVAQLPNGSTAYIDGVVIYRNDGLSQPTFGARHTVSQGDVTTIDWEKTDLTGHDVAPIGEAHLLRFGDNETLSVEPGPDEGVAMEVGTANSFNFQIASVMTESEEITVRSVGRFNESPESTLGTLRYRHIGAFFDVFADFSGIGSTHAHVIVMQNGIPVLDIPSAVMPIVATNPPTGIRKIGGPLECYFPDWPDGTLFMVNGLFATGNQVAILAEGVTGQIKFKSRVDVTSSGQPFEIRDLHSEGTFVDSFFDVFYGDLFSVGDNPFEIQGDGAKLEVLCDGTTFITGIDLVGTHPLKEALAQHVQVAMSVARPGLSVAFQKFDRILNDWIQVAGGIAPTIDAFFDVFYGDANLREFGRATTLRMITAPINDEDPSQDGWLTSVDLARVHYVR